MKCDMKKLKEIESRIETLQNDVTDVLKLEDNELNGDCDIYNKLQEVLDAIEEVREECD